MSDDVAEQIRREIRQREPSIRAFARRAGLPSRSVQSYLDGKQPTVNRAAEICRALGLEFYVGPPRETEVPSKITKALGLPVDASVDDAVNVIETYFTGKSLDVERLQTAIEAGAWSIAHHDLDADLELMAEIIATLYDRLDEDDDPQTATIAAADVIDLSEYRQKRKDA